MLGPTFRVLGLFDYELGTQAEYDALRLAGLISRSGREAPVVVPVAVPASSNLRLPATFCFHRQLHLLSVLLGSR